jgi:hypothetical protein
MIGRLPIEEMHGSDRVPDLSGLRASLVGWKRQPINESEMALFSECSLQYARKVLDTADIVREAIYRQSRQVSLVLEARLPRSSLREGQYRIIHGGRASRIIRTGKPVLSR